MLYFRPFISRRWRQILSSCYDCWALLLLAQRCENRESVMLKKLYRVPFVGLMALATVFIAVAAATLPSPTSTNAPDQKV